MPRTPRTGNRNRHLPAFLLLFLREGPAHGAVLKARLDQLLPELDIEAGAIYRTLRDLDERGALVSTWEPSVSGQARRIYSLTEKGQAELACWQADIHRRLRALQTFLDLYEQGGEHHEPAG